MATAIGSYAVESAVEARIGRDLSEADQAVLTEICDAVNDFVENTATGRVIAPIEEEATEYLLDGNGRDKLYFPRGIREITKLEIAASAGGTFTELDAGTYFIRPSATERRPGWPAMWIVLAHGRFPKGFDNVRSTMLTGFPAIPDAVTNLAEVAAQKWWNARESGFQQTSGVDEQGRPIAARFFEIPDFATLMEYAIPVVG